MFKRDQALERELRDPEDPITVIRAKIEIESDDKLQYS